MKYYWLFFNVVGILSRCSLWLLRFIRWCWYKYCSDRKLPTRTQKRSLHGNSHPDTFWFAYAFVFHFRMDITNPWVAWNKSWILKSVVLFFLVDGSWSGWSDWSGWAKGLCSGNQRVRTKTCTNPVPSIDGNYCSGDNAENEPGSGGQIFGFIHSVIHFLTQPLILSFFILHSSIVHSFIHSFI